MFSDCLSVHRGGGGRGSTPVSGLGPFPASGPRSFPASGPRSFPRGMGGIPVRVPPLARTRMWGGSTPDRSSVRSPSPLDSTRHGQDQDRGDGGKYPSQVLNQGTPPPPPAAPGWGEGAPQSCPRSGRPSPRTAYVGRHLRLRRRTYLFIISMK